MLGHSSPFDLAVLHQPWHPHLPPLSQPEERYAYLNNALLQANESKARFARGEDARPISIIHGVVRKCVSSFGEKVYTELTEREMQAEFVVWRVMHAVGAIETQFCPMQAYKLLRLTPCTCMGNLALLQDWPDTKEWRFSE